MIYYRVQSLLKLHYLFMLADGNRSPAEDNRFDEICKTMEVTEKDRNEAISFCREAVPVLGRDNAATVIREIQKLLDFEAARLDNLYRVSIQELTLMLWNLIQIGYADGVYSEAEKKVVAFLADYWKIPRLISNELIDTAETILALTHQKEWLKTTNKPYDVISANITKIDAAISRMAKNVEILISESHMA